LTLPKIISTRNYINLRYLFLAFYINDNGMFLCLYKNDIEIHHYNFDGELKDIYLYKHKKGDEYYVTDLRALNQGERYKFYVLTYFPWPRVRIFNSN